MKATRPGEIIHMTYITSNTRMEGRISILVSVDNYSNYCFGIAVEQEIALPEIEMHITGILQKVHEHHPKIQPLFVLAYGKEWLQVLQDQFKSQATFMFNIPLADEIAMPAAKMLLEWKIHAN
jgi:hypothetical protein